MNSLPKDIICIISKMIDLSTRVKLSKTCKSINSFFPQPSRLVTKNVFKKWFNIFEEIVGCSILELIVNLRNIYFKCKYSDDRLYFVYKENVNEQESTYIVTIINQSRLKIDDLIDKQYIKFLTLHKNYLVFTFRDFNDLTKFFCEIYTRVIVNRWDGLDEFQYLRKLFSSSLQSNDFYQYNIDHFLNCSSIIGGLSSLPVKSKNLYYRRQVEDKFNQLINQMREVGLNKEERHLFILNKRFD